MDHQPKQLRQKEEHQADLSRSTQVSTPTEFQSAEEAIRADRNQTELPASLEIRVAQAVNQNPAPPQSWWTRLFRRK